MSPSQTTLLVILGLTLAGFVSARVRHDVVALAALLATVIVGFVPGDKAFDGFAHPAVVTVACVLVLSRSLHVTGAIDALAKTILPDTSNRLLAMGALMAVGGVMSGFVNNVGAMALLMPIAFQLSNRLGLAPGQVLMPLAFSTILGGMTTLIGTPPNLIVSGFRDDTGLPPFEFFSFTPVGLPVACAGIAAIALAGWRLVPVRRPATAEAFETAAYLTEVRVPEESPAIGMTLRNFEREAGNEEVQVIGLVRNGVKLTAPHGARKIKAHDILALETDVETMGDTLAKFRFDLDLQREEEAQSEGDPEEVAESAPSPEPESDESEVELREFVVMHDTALVRRTAAEMQFRTYFGVNLIALSREGRKPHTRLRSTRFRVGDLMLLQGTPEALQRFAAETGGLPLHERDIRLPDWRRAVLSMASLGGAVVLATLGVFPTPVAFMLGVLAVMVTGAIPLRQVYTAIDWPVIVLLAALIPVAGAMQETGLANVIATGLVSSVAQDNAVAALVVVLVTTMFLSDLMNNAATAAVMCPIAIEIGTRLDSNSDTFLMAVAIGASCAFLTPIGHQNNTLILGTGGFRFSDYWRLGLPLEILVVCISVPVLLMAWPL